MPYPVTVPVYVVNSAASGEGIFVIAPGPDVNMTLGDRGELLIEQAPGFRRGRLPAYAFAFTEGAAVLMAQDAITREIARLERSIADANSQLIKLRARGSVFRDSSERVP